MVGGGEGVLDDVNEGHIVLDLDVVVVSISPFKKKEVDETGLKCSDKY